MYIHVELVQTNVNIAAIRTRVIVLSSEKFLMIEDIAKKRRRFIKIETSSGSVKVKIS